MIVLTAEEHRTFEKLLAELQEMLRNTMYRDGVATGLTTDHEAVEFSYNEVRKVLIKKGSLQERIEQAQKAYSDERERVLFLNPASPVSPRERELHQQWVDLVQSAGR